MWPGPATERPPRSNTDTAVLCNLCLRSMLLWWRQCSSARSLITLGGAGAAELRADRATSKCERLLCVERNVPVQGELGAGGGLSEVSEGRLPRPEGEDTLEFHSNPKRRRQSRGSRGWLAENEGLTGNRVDAPSTTRLRVTRFVRFTWAVMRVLSRSRITPAWNIFLLVDVYSAVYRKRSDCSWQQPLIIGDDVLVVYHDSYHALTIHSKKGA